MDMSNSSVAVSVSLRPLVMSRNCEVGQVGSAYLK
jgi:hypothetical protein